MKLRSNFPANSAHAVTRRAQWVSLGIDPAELERPKVAIVNTSNDLAACFAHLDDIVVVLKEELHALGMLPFEIRTAAPSDFITNAGRGGRYVLTARDVMVNDIEVMVEGAQLDAMICLSSCDKTTPAHLMAAGRLNVPTVIVPCGYQRSGLSEGGESDVEEVFLRAAQQALDGKVDESLTRLADGAIRGPGVCSGLATANSMHMAAEALGMAVTGAAPVRATSDRMWDNVRRAARAITSLVEREVRPRDIITAGSITNAVRTMLAVGGSINTVKHLQAVAVEAGLDVDVWDAYRVLGRETPTLCSIRPNGPHLIEALEDAGGAATVLHELLPLLDGEQLTVDGGTIKQNATAARPGDGTVIRSLDGPFSTDPSIVVLRGTLAKEGAVVKRPIPDPGPRRFRGPAKIFHSREEGVAAVVDGKIEAGDVTIIRGIGVTGGPAMGMISAFIFALDGRGLASSVAVITDGQMSGLVNHGIGVGEVSPEAAGGGALGLIQDGDLIEIDLEEGRLDVLVDPDELAARPPFVPQEQVETNGVLDQYRATVQSLACGAVLCARPGPTPAQAQ
ncbi:dihydroxy-acid dehydratase [Phytoactinopolyspora endophytica]|uniref:dihydroxy-acid dehydratase n=1 Tax=Phytoactinopolyspora endophytica TaxID=1642495 RepID=UPI00101D9385|nr:dihydroxy-acid dehydratase [Phytoactinopolyspora endophytica]